MSIEVHNHDGFKVEEIISPNKSPRWLKPFVKREVILIHATASTNMDGTIGWFLNKESQVSADFVIGKTGRIVRMVPKTHIAWHAGVCRFRQKDRRDYNYVAYGIELVNKNDGFDLYPTRQLEALAYVCALIQNESPTVQFLRRHADVGIPQGRKSDPNGLSLSRIYQTISLEQPGCRFF